jgi:hypothetical protein
MNAWLASGIVGTSNALERNLQKLQQAHKAPNKAYGIGGSLRVTKTSFGMRRADSALARYTPNSIKWLGHEPKVLAPVAVGSEKVATGTYIRMETGPSMLTAPDRELTRSSYLLSGPTIGSRMRSNARRGDAPLPPGCLGHRHDA